MKLAALVMSLSLNGAVTGSIPRMAELRNFCEEPYVVVKNGRRSYKRKQIPEEILERDRKKAKKMAKLVAKEMGADYRLLLIWMARGSKSNPYAIHVMKGDMDAHKKAWREHHWTPAKEKRLVSIIERYDSDDDLWWQAKADLKKVLKYKDNLYFQYKKPIEVVDENGQMIKSEKINIFHMAYGPIDMNSILYLHMWDSESPPWIMCDNYGLVSYIVAIWAARKFQKECEANGLTGSYGVIDRRYARGRCYEPNNDFKDYARRYKLDPYKRARLGEKFPQEKTNREDLIEYLLDKAKKEKIIE